MRISFPTATARVGEAPLRWTQQMHDAAFSRLRMESRSKVMTSNILMVLSSSSPAVAKNAPSTLTEEPKMCPSCAAYSLANSIPVATFFQNLTTPSMEVVMTKSTGEGAMVTDTSWSLCINDLEYLAPLGKAST